MQCDNDYEGIANFTLNAEDMETVGIHLKSVLLPFEQLEITGDLGEGIVHKYPIGLLGIAQ